MSKTTTGVAAAGLVMPAWVPTLETVSATAAALVPVLSALWLLLQITRFVARWRRGATE